jgi:hypothetical protein
MYWLSRDICGSIAARWVFPRLHPFHVGTLVHAHEAIESMLTQEETICRLKQRKENRWQDSSQSVDVRALPIATFAIISAGV